MSNELPADRDHQTHDDVWPPAPAEVPGARPTPPPPPRGGAAPSNPTPPRGAPDGAVLVDQQATNWSLLAHLSGLLATAAGGMGFFGPLLVWLLKRDDHPYVVFNAVEALNFQLSMLLYGLVLVLTSLPVVTMLVTLPLGLIGLGLWVILPVVGAIKASKGETWRYPLTIAFVK